MSLRPYRQGIPQEILALSHERDLLRRRGQYKRADLLKQQIEDAGYAIKDNPRGAHLIILPNIDIDGHVYRTIRHVPSLLDEPDNCMFSINILVRDNYDAAHRCLESVLRYGSEHDIEILLIDNASQAASTCGPRVLESKNPNCTCCEPHVHLVKQKLAISA